VRYLPKSPAEREAMFAELGLASEEDLFASIPTDLRQQDPLSIPPGQSEYEIRDYFEARARDAARGYACFLGAGAYHHYTPAVIPHLLFRSELYTAYTPYQPEVSQGTLQTIFEFQTMVARLLGMEVANASMYDGSTALAEAALMAARLRRGRRSNLEAPRRFSSAIPAPRPGSGRSPPATVGWWSRPSASQAAADRAEQEPPRTSRASHPRTGPEQRRDQNRPR